MSKNPSSTPENELKKKPGRPSKKKSTAKKPSVPAASMLKREKDLSDSQVQTRKFNFSEEVSSIPDSKDSSTSSVLDASVTSAKTTSEGSIPEKNDDTDDQANEPHASRNTLWIILTVILAIFLGVFLLYEYQPAVREQVQKALFTQTVPPIKLPMTIVYDSSDQTGVKALKEKFLLSLIDPTKGLKNTEIQETWYQPGSPLGQNLIKEVDAKYLPLAVFDGSIEKHPQFNDLKNYLEKKGDHYFFHLYPLMHLEVPGIAGGHVQGSAPEKAAVVIIEYSSYTCPFCREMEEPINRLMAEFPGKISRVLKNFDRKPFNGSAIDNLLTQATECANEQNKFWNLHEELFKDQDNFLKFLQDSQEKDADTAVRKYLEGKTKNAGLNAKNFFTCFDSKKYAKASDTTTLEAIKYGVSGTPGFFINGKFYDGSFRDEKGKVSYDLLKAAVQKAMGLPSTTAAKITGSPSQTQTQTQTQARQ